MLSIVTPAGTIHCSHECIVVQTQTAMVQARPAIVVAKLICQAANEPGKTVNYVDEHGIERLQITWGINPQIDEIDLHMKLAVFTCREGSTRLRLAINETEWDAMHTWAKDIASLTMEPSVYQRAIIATLSELGGGGMTVSINSLQRSLPGEADLISELRVLAMMGFVQEISSGAGYRLTRTGAECLLD